MLTEGIVFCIFISKERPAIEDLLTTFPTLFCFSINKYGSTIYDHLCQMGIIFAF